MFKTIAALLGGPAGVVTEWFASFYGKLIGFLAIVALIGGLGTSVYFSWTNNIREGEQAKLAAQQAEQLARDKDAEIKQLKSLDEAKEKAQKDLAAATATGNSNSEAIKTWIATQPAPADRPVSSVIQETFDRLYGKDK